MSFIVGRHITDNIIVAQEIVHSIHIKKGKKRLDGYKSRLEKAYDRIRWDFIEDTLLDVGFPILLVKVFIEFLFFVFMKIVWHSNLSNVFCPLSGIRQGCPYGKVGTFYP